MFTGAFLDAFPQWQEKVIAVVHQVLPMTDITLECGPYNDGVLTGSLFEVILKTEADKGHTHHHDHESSHEDHGHKLWKDIKHSIESADIDEGVRCHALGIFQALAEVEALCHGVAVEDVSFHEVGAYDSIADILAAACIIDQLGPSEWSMSSLPSGSGQVSTAHGILPVPAPAVVRLLEGYDLHDDGLKGERITPTGAAILKYLNPSQNLKTQPQTLMKSGYGFGTKRFPGLCNVLRTMIYTGEEHADKLLYNHDTVIELNFEVDDQSPEDFSVALDNIRQISGCLDVSYFMGTGKKSRPTFSVRVLAKPADNESVLEACFTQTTTLGIRESLQNRVILRRTHIETPSGHPVKIGHRPNGSTAKLEMSVLEQQRGDIISRKALRIQEEATALKLYKKGDENE